MKMRRLLLFTMVCILAIGLLSQCCLAAIEGPDPPSFPQAKAWLKKMSDYMNTLDRFQVHVQTTRELIFPQGGRLDVDSYGDIYADRPNMLRVDIFRPTKGRQIYYDGTSLTVYTPKLNVYGTVPAPSTTQQMLSKVRTEYGINIPLADLLRPNLYENVMPNIETGMVVGPSFLNGVYCKQLAFRSEDMDVQIWIEDSQTPLPRRMVIVDRGVKGNPRYMVTLTQWDTNPTFDAGTFKFTPPEGAQKIEFVKPGQASTRAR